VLQDKCLLLIATRLCHPRRMATIRRARKLKISPATTAEGRPSYNAEDVAIDRRVIGKVRDLNAPRADSRTGDGARRRMSQAYAV
jgi:hypothetical protein